MRGNATTLMDESMMKTAGMMPANQKPMKTTIGETVKSLQASKLK
jgi:hypothetical protein